LQARGVAAVKQVIRFNYEQGNIDRNGFNRGKQLIKELSLNGIQSPLIEELNQKVYYKYQALIESN
jgi:hypothetical protein